MKVNLSTQELVLTALMLEPALEFTRQELNNPDLNPLDRTMAQLAHDDLQALMAKYKLWIMNSRD